MSIAIPLVITVINATSGFVENPEWQKNLFQRQRENAAIVHIDGDNRNFMFSQMNSDTNLLITKIGLRDIARLNPVKKPYPLEYWLTPGDYQLTISCQAWRDNRNVMAEGVAKVKLEQGKEYTVKVIGTPAYAKDWNQFGACLPSVVETSTPATKTGAGEAH